MADIGHCKHGEFNLIDGCIQCISERLAEQLKEKLKTNIVKVKYFSETTGEMSSREYTYYSADRLNVGDIIIVPVRNTTVKAKVSAIDVPEKEIEAFKDKVKTIPAGSIEIAHDEKEGEPMFEPVTTDMLHAAVEQAFTPPETIAIALRPGEDIAAHSYFEESRKMLEYAEKRAIRTIEDAKSATDDLSAISRLKKAMETKRKEALSPHEAQVKAIRDTYNYLMTPVLEAERITKEKQTAFLHEQERIKQEQKEINRKRMEAAQQEMKLKGELSESVNLVEVQEAPQKVSTDFGSSGLRDNWTFEIISFADLPDEYKMPDATKIGKVVRAGLRNIPGIRIFNKPILAVRPH